MNLSAGLPAVRGQECLVSLTACHPVQPARDDSLFLLLIEKK